jgi:Tol biopolymer transport system component
MDGRLVLICLGLAGAAYADPSATAPARDDPAVTALTREVGDKGWIVYGARSSEGDWDLYLCRPDGSAVRNITNTPEFNEAGPRFSPDGKRLLYRRLARDATINHDRWGFQGRLMIARNDGTEPNAIGGDGELPWAGWSPDGKQISCLTLKGVEIVDLATKKVLRRIPRQGLYQQLTWSADGKWLCGVSNHFGESWTVARMNVGTGEINPVNKFQNCTPDWLPDSERMIWSHRPGNQGGYGWTQLWVGNADGRDVHLIYGEDGRHLYGGGASPDGKYIVFSSCPQDGGGAEKDGAPIGILRLADAPIITGESEALRKLHPNTHDGPVLLLPITGWEPHWTYAEVQTADEHR